MKNIVFVIADLGMGGAQRVISLLAEKLAIQPDTRIDIVTMSNDADKSFFLIPDNVKVHALAGPGNSHTMLSAIYANIIRVKNLRAILRQLAPRIVVSFQTETNCTTLLATIGTGIPVVVSERSDPYVHPQSRIWRVIRRLAYPLARGAVMQTAHAQRYFREIVKNSVVIFNPVSVDENFAITLPAGPYILGVGRLSAEKGFDDLIAAHAIASRKCPDLGLVLVGDGPEKSALMQQAQLLGTIDKVTFTGSQHRPGGYYRSALAFVLPSRFEGLPNALLEAMAYGCAVISTPLFAAAPEIISHRYDGLIATEGRAQGLAEQIIYIYENKDTCDELRKNAFISAQRFEGNAICAAWLRFLETLATDSQS